ncbi:MAG TPA: hypothetical protein VG796_15700 [Verrucomicrobiales bacterium]|jgi:hypothetical protein|nr:hypothetical protein [Verrucomicrobiales bacterium]
MNLQLYYDRILVGDIMEAFCHQDTWFGTFKQSFFSQADDTGQRIGEFIAFCQVWNERCKTSENPDASEFDQFGDLLTSQRWFTKGSEGTSSEIDQAPNFFEEEISWQLTGRTYADK